MGIVKNVHVMIGPCILPIDIVVMNVSYDPFHLIILGRPFIVTSDMKIYQKRELISLKFGKDEIQLTSLNLSTKHKSKQHILKKMTYPTIWPHTIWESPECFGEKSH
jgi:hypothetical protein